MKAETRLRQEVTDDNDACDDTQPSRKTDSRHQQTPTVGRIDVCQLGYVTRAVFDSGYAGDHGSNVMKREPQVVTTPATR